MGIKYWDRQIDNLKYPLIMIMHGKHENIYCIVNSKQELFDKSIALVKFNNEFGYYCGEDEEKVKAIIKEKDGYHAFILLKERSNDEYERFSMEYPI